MNRPRSPLADVSELADHYRAGLAMLPARWLDGLPGLEHVGSWIRPVGAPMEIWHDDETMEPGTIEGEWTP